MNGISQKNLAICILQREIFCIQGVQVRGMVEPITCPRRSGPLIPKVTGTLICFLHSDRNLIRKFLN